MGSISREGGGRLQYKNVWMCVLGSENVPILKNALGKKNIPILEGSSAYFVPILWCNIKLKRSFEIHHYFCKVYVGCSSLCTILLHKCLPIFSDAANFTPILSHSSHSLEAEKGPMSFTFGQTHPGKAAPRPLGHLSRVPEKGRDARIATLSHPL